MPSRRKSSRSSRSKNSEPQGLTRARIVWISFFGAMTLAGGLLLLVDAKPSPRTDGFSLSPLAFATTVGNQTSDPVIQTRVPIDAARWQAIVIHHSGSTVGSPASIAKEHQAAGLQGLGHHFIIGNGSGMDDGQVHIGYRWLDQLPGAVYVAGPNGDFYNQHSISICLVGDGNRRGFTPAQTQQLAQLIESLRKKLDLPADRVLLHSDIAPVSDPGKLFPAGLGGLPAARP